MLPETAACVNFANVGAQQICFYEKGDGPPILLLHGMFGDLLDWEPVLEPLSSRHRVVALDLPGFGDSGKPCQGYNAEFFLTTLHTFLCQRQIPDVTLVGNSFGGQIAILYALRHPESVAKLVLVDSGGFKQYTREEIAFTEARFTESAIAALTPEINTLLFSPVFSRPSPAREQYVARQNAKLKRADYAVYAYAIAQSIRLSLSTYLLDRISQLRCPVLLLWGEKDPVLPLALAEQALRQLQHGELKVLRGCGHTPQLECPGTFLDSILPFLRTTA